MSLSVKLTIWVRPHEVAHASFVRDFLLPINSSNFVHLVNFGGKTAMDSKDLVVDEGCQTQVVKNFSAVSPYICASIFPDAFIIEAVDLGDLPAFVVSSNQRNSVGIAHF